uniref:Uncharacterized protein n=1 Tax=Arundo donax TaxID=35708 RepID=A0A0A9B6H0_ARUDO
MLECGFIMKVGFDGSSNNLISVLTT